MHLAISYIVHPEDVKNNTSKIGVSTHERFRRTGLPGIKTEPSYAVISFSWKMNHYETCVK